MKLRAPDTCDGVSHNGRILALSVGKCVEIADDDGQALVAHGFTSCEAKAPAVSDRNDAAACEMSAELATRSLASRFQGGGEPVAIAPPPDQAAPTLARLGRRALFAQLREKGVRVRLPISNEELRLLAAYAGGVD